MLLWGIYRYRNGCLGVDRVLHVEVGGSYGGSQRALQLYLKGCDRSLFRHDVLFIYPTPGSERFLPVADRVETLLPAEGPPANGQGETGSARKAYPLWMRNAWRLSAPGWNWFGVLLSCFAWPPSYAAATMTWWM